MLVGSGKSRRTEVFCRREFSGFIFFPVIILVSGGCRIGPDMDIPGLRGIGDEFNLVAEGVGQKIAAAQYQRIATGTADGKPGISGVKVGILGRFGLIFNPDKMGREGAVLFQGVVPIGNSVIHDVAVKDDGVWFVLSPCCLKREGY